MNKNGPLVVIEDDMDDQDLIAMVLKELEYPNEIRFFTDGEEALSYLQKDDIYPFLILSDINMPKLDGLKLKTMIQTNKGLAHKCIPYLFFTTSVNQKAVFDAYTMSAQGFFLKPSRYEELQDTIKAIIEYWQKCYSPNYIGEVN